MNLEAASTIGSGNEPLPGADPRPGQAPPACDPECLEKTCRSLQQFGLATDDEIQKLHAHGSAPLSGPRAWDPLEFVAALRVEEPEARPVEIERLGRGLGTAVGQNLMLIPFAARMPTPSAFYDSHAELRLRCQQLLAPVLYSEESEVVGIASINPVAMDLAEQAIIGEMSSRTGVVPIVSKVLLYQDSWVSLCKKQFAL